MAQEYFSKRKNWAWVAATLLSIVCLSGCVAIVNRNTMSSDNRITVSQLLETGLPADVEEIQYFHSQPAQHLTFFTDYIKFRTSREMYFDLMKRMNMDFYDSGGDDLFYLPAAWETEPGVKIEWWDPTSDTPVDAAAKSYQNNGWIVAKYERGNVYIIITDTGFAEPTSQP